MKKSGIKGLIICLCMFFYVNGFAQEYENKVTCEHINSIINTNSLKGEQTINGFVYNYKDMTLYMLYTNLWVYHRTSGASTGPTHVVKPFYYFFKNNSDTLYSFSDSLKLMKLFSISQKDSLLNNNTLNLLTFNKMVIDTLRFKIEKKRKRKKRIVIFCHNFSYLSNISKDSYFKIYLSKRKLYLHHQIAPQLDSVSGMRTYRVVENYKANKEEVFHNIKVLSFSKMSITNKKYKLSSDRKAEVIEMFDSCLAKSANPAGAIRNWFPKGADISK